MELKIINKNGITLDLINNRNYFILYKADNLHGLDIDIAEMDSPYFDGTFIDNVRALPRGIVLSFYLKGDIKKSIDFFTKHIKTKQRVKLIEKDHKGERVIEGIVNIPPYTTMLRTCTIDLEIYCNQPYWEDLKELQTTLSTFINLLYLPKTGQYFTQIGRPFGAFDLQREKTIENESDTAVGINIAIVAMGDVDTPRLSCSTGEQEGYFMELAVKLNNNDIVEINTNRGHKSIKLNGLSTYNNIPLISLLTFKGKDWLQLEQGANTFNITAKGGLNNVMFTLSYKGRYE